MRHSAYIGGVQLAFPRFAPCIIDGVELVGFGFSPLCIQAVGASSFDQDGGRFHHLLHALAAAAVSARPAILAAWAYMQVQANVETGVGDTLLARPVEQLCAGADKPQPACTQQIEEYRHRRLQVEYAQFSADDRRRVAFRNCDSYGRCRDVLRRTGTACNYHMIW